MPNDKGRRRRRRNIDVDVRVEIERLANSPSANATAIHRSLVDDDRFEGRVPLVRTVQSIVKESRVRDSSGTWSLQDAATPDEARILLPVLGAKLALSERADPLTNEEAKWALVVGRAVPDLSARNTYTMARAYLVRSERGEPAADLDVLLALRTWESTEASEAAWKAGKLSNEAVVLSEVMRNEAPIVDEVLVSEAVRGGPIGVTPEQDAAADDGRKPRDYVWGPISDDD
jgi:hypothetical protein